MEGGVPTRWWQVGILLQIAFRNLLASRAKSLIVGGITLFGAMLVVVGSSLVDSVDSGMRRSIQASLGGHIQVYDARSRDDLSLYGGIMGESDLVPFEDFSRVKRLLESVPNVKSVVPMGIDQAVVGMGNLMDVALEHLRGDVRRCLAGKAEDAALPTLLQPGGGVRGGESPCAGDPAIEAEYQARKAHVRRMATLLRSDLVQARAIAADDAPEARDWERWGVDLARATDDGFWRNFDRDPLGSLEFLENRIAPLSMDNGVLFIRYVGTDLDAYMKAFEGAQIVEGGPVPRGQRGILLGKLYAEDWLKLRTARRLDKIKDARDLHHRRIASDEELQRWVKENQAATREILLQLDPIRARQATERLQRALSTEEDDLQKLVVQLLATDDGNFDERYRIFYGELAPLLQLYPVKVGDTITIQAPSKSGYMNSVNVKVYGFVQWKGLEKSSLAGMMSVMDILSFRDLYGYVTPEKAAEIRRLKEEAGLRSIPRESAEAELFGGGAAAAPLDPAPSRGEEREEQGSRAAAIDAGRLLDAGAAGRRKQGLDAHARAYTQDDIDHGVAKNAAVILKDPRRVGETIRDIEAAAARADLPLKAVGWQEASGMVGQFITLARLILYTAVFIIFVVALVIINNAMVMATLQRVKEIGTMRAIGAQRRFVLVMLLVETVAVGLAFGAAGAGLGVGAVWLLGALGGIPATNDQVYFFFSGPTLVPRLGAASLGISLLIVLVVSVLSGLYPALLATRVAPVEAMQSDD
jgi:ABC-type lipoprotein release transport system permease subunit